jgi:hypothetical protein
MVVVALMLTNQMLAAVQMGLTTLGKRMKKEFLKRPRN